MLAIWNRCGFSPTPRIVSWNKGSCVRGVHEATTTRFSPCSSICSRMRSCVSCEQVYRLCSAKATPGKPAAYSTTSGTFTTAPMLMPQWQIKTPTCGISPLTSRSSGQMRSSVNVPRALASSADTWAAAQEASITVSGMSLGSPNAPATNMPGRVVCAGCRMGGSAKPYSLSAIPNRSANSRVPSGGFSPTESTTRSNSSSTFLPSAVAYLTRRLPVPGASVTVLTMLRT